MKDSFDRAFALVLKYEGGFSNNPKDPGGPTNLGVTQKTLSAWLGKQASVGDVKALTKAKVAPIYRKNYWDAVRGDELPAGLDYAVFDYAVNSGTHKAVMGLQKALGIADDGKLGPITLAAARKAGTARVAPILCADRLAFLKRLKTWPTFGQGWSARVWGVEREALKMPGGK